MKQNSGILIVMILLFVSCGQGWNLLDPVIPHTEYDQYIAYSSNRDGNFDVFIMKPDGSGQTNLTNHPEFESGPQWARDGSLLSFHSNRTTPYQGMYTMKIDGSGVKFNYPIDYDWRAWGQHINRDSTLRAYGDGINGKNELFIENLITTEITQITDNEFSEWAPQISPDGLKIAFERYVNNKYEIFVMNRNGSNEIRLSEDRWSDYSPTWSPDGQKIAFSSNRDGDSDIYVINADGSGLAQLTDNDYSDRWPAWSPFLDKK